MNMLEHPDCPLCGSSLQVDVHELAWPHHLVRCAECSLHYLHPRLTEDAMRRHYERDDYFEGGETGYAGYAAQEHSLRATFRRLLANMSVRGLTGGSLLEVGCGYGYLLDEARPYFHHREGTEYSERGVELSRRSGDAIYQGGISSVPAGSKFDCIVATQVIEHVYLPVVFIRQLAAHLAPGGAVVLATPDIGGLLRRVMGRRWPSLKTPEHVAYFDARTLGRAMRMASLEQIARLPHPHAFPLGLLGSKLRIPIPRSLRSLDVWVPGTTLALYGRAAGGACVETHMGADAVARNTPTP